jgi:hypothetical protein
MICPKCGLTELLPDCKEHNDNDALYCIKCGYREYPNDKCPTCGKRQYKKEYATDLSYWNLFIPWPNNCMHIYKSIEEYLGGELDEEDKQNGIVVAVAKGIIIK